MKDSLYATQITIDPTFPVEWLIALAALAMVALLFAYWQQAKGLIFRTFLLGILLTLLLNPSLVTETRSYLKDVVLLIIDQTDSQKIGDRPVQTQKAVQEITRKLKQFETISIETITVTNSTGANDSSENKGTRLFEARATYLAAHPRNRVAATILVTDGQIHDIPTTSDPANGPVHTVLTGAPDETDRVLIIENAPTYGIVGKSVTLTFKVTDNGVPTPQQTVMLTVKQDGIVIRRLAVTTGQSQNLKIEIPHGGANHVILEAATLDGELSKKNNSAVVRINGIRDRLKVLLVSGEPYMGERSWRNILKSDPSVELVHFTILRPPEKQDGTPLKELSLIPFPINELFERKLGEFDLIIFDRYQRRGVLPDRYLNNIVKYVNDGGAFLEAAGPSFAGAASIYKTPLSSILRAAPTGQIFKQPFTPRLSDTGKRHPVTASLPSYRPSKKWGKWFRMIDSTVTSANILMTGPNDRPLLVLNKQGKGRVAQLLSDHAWLWGKGFDGGGPQAELFRRTAYWLMKEPELDEERLSAKIVAGQIEITRQSLQKDNPTVDVTAPDGQTSQIALSAAITGKQKGTAPLTGRGIYRLQSGKLSTLLAVGALNPLEEREIRATDVKIRAFGTDTQRGIHWLRSGPIPNFKRTSPANNQASRTWWGLRDNKNYNINGYSKKPLISPLLGIFLLLGSLCALWWRESR